MTHAPARPRPDAPPWTPPPPGPLVLAPGETHLWRIQAEGPVAPALESVLDAEEAARARAYRREEDRRLHVHAHAALRHVLARYADAAPDALRFTRRCLRCGGDRGKPRLAPPLQGPEFSLSHSGGLALLAVSLDPVGVDVERVKPIDVDALAAASFAQDERDALSRSPPDARLAAFYALWTGREARLKLSGDGFGHDPDPHVPVPCVTRLDAGPRHAAALATPAPPARLRALEWQPAATGP